MLAGKILKNTHWAILENIKVGVETFKTTPYLITPK